MNRQIIVIGIRWVAAIGLLIAAFSLAPKESVEVGEDVTQAAAHSFKGVVMMLAAVGLIAPEIIALVTRGAQKVVGNIFFPSDAGTAPPNYKIIRFYRKEGRYEEALEQCFVLLGNHPQEMWAYAAGVENAILAGSAEKAAKFLSMAQRKLKSKEAVEYVEAIHARATQMDRADLAAEEMEMEEEEMNDGSGGYTNGYGGPTGGYAG